MTTKQDVIRLNRAHPDWTAREIADELGCNPGYVRATAKRCMLELARGDVAYRRAVKRLEEAAAVMLAKYIGLVNSREAGFWNPEEEGSVIELKEALKMEKAQ
jgi:hypothetical protein